MNAKTLNSSARYRVLQEFSGLIDIIVTRTPPGMLTRNRSTRTAIADALVSIVEAKGDELSKFTIDAAATFLIGRLQAYKRSGKYQGGFPLTLINWLAEEEYNLPDSAWDTAKSARERRMAAQAYGLQPAAAGKIEATMTYREWLDSQGVPPDLHGMDAVKWLRENADVHPGDRRLREALS